MDDYYDDYYEEEEEGEEDLLSTIIGAGIGIFLGLAGAAVIDSLLGYRCPRCNGKIQKNAPMCNHCNNYLRWE